MSLTLPIASARLGREMLDAENKIADALVSTAALLHSAALAHRDVGGTSPAKTQQTFARLLKKNSDLVDAQGEAMRVHGQLLDHAVETGATEQPTCPDKPFTSAELQSAAA